MTPSHQVAVGDILAGPLDPARNNDRLEAVRHSYHEGYPRARITGAPGERRWPVEDRRGTQERA